MPTLNDYTNRFIDTIDPLIRNYTSPLGFKLRPFVTMDYFKGKRHCKRYDEIGEAKYGDNAKVSFSQVKATMRFIDRTQLINSVKATSEDASKADREFEADINRRTQDLVDSLGKLEDKFILEGISGVNKTEAGDKILGPDETIAYNYWCATDHVTEIIDKDIYIKYGMNANKVLAGLTNLSSKGWPGPFICVSSHYDYQTFRADPIVQNMMTSNVKSMTQDVFYWDRISAFVTLDCIPSERKGVTINNVQKNADIRYAYIFSQNNIILNEFDSYVTEAHPIWDEAGSRAIKMFATLGASRLEESGVARIECASNIS